MPRIKLDRTIKFKGNTYKLGETVEISVEDVDMLRPYGAIIEEEQPKTEEPKKPIKRSTKRVGK